MSITKSKYPREKGEIEGQGCDSLFFRDIKELLI